MEGSLASGLSALDWLRWEIGGPWCPGGVGHSAGSPFRSLPPGSGERVGEGKGQGPSHPCGLQVWGVPQTEWGQKWPELPPTPRPSLPQQCGLCFCAPRSCLPALPVFAPETPPPPCPSARLLLALLSAPFPAPPGCERTFYLREVWGNGWGLPCSPHKT